MNVNPNFLPKFLVVFLIFTTHSGFVNSKSYVSDGVSNWITDSNSDCTAFNLRPKVGEVIKWYGACKDGYIHGVGKLEWRVAGELTEISEGDFNMGRQHGIGTREWPSKGDRYVGAIYNGRFNGIGKYYFKSGRRYEGNFKDGSFNGVGVLYGSDGAVLKSGLWKNGSYIGADEKSSNQRNSDKCINLGLREGTRDFDLCIRSLKK